VVRGHTASESGENEAAGRRVFESTACLNCQQWWDKTHRRLAGPNPLMSRRTIASAPRRTTPNLAPWIQPGSIKPGSLMPAMKLSDTELDARALWHPTTLLIDSPSLLQGFEMRTSGIQFGVAQLHCRMRDPGLIESGFESQPKILGVSPRRLTRSCGGSSSGLGPGQNRRCVCPSNCRDSLSRRCSRRLVFPQLRFHPIRCCCCRVPTP